LISASFDLCDRQSDENQYIHQHHRLSAVGSRTRAVLLARGICGHQANLLNISYIRTAELSIIAFSTFGPSQQTIVLVSAKPPRWGRHSAQALLVCLTGILASSTLVTIRSRMQTNHSTFFTGTSPFFHVFASSWIILSTSHMCKCLQPSSTSSCRARGFSILSTRQDRTRLPVLNMRRPRVAGMLVL